MSTSQPAPWSFDKYGSIVDANGKTLTVIGVAIPTGSRRHDTDPVYANTRLIAAAPELLEACKIIVDAFDSLSQSSPARNETLHINAARAAIAKATGAE